MSADTSDETILWEEFTIDQISLLIQIESCIRTGLMGDDFTRIAGRLDISFDIRQKIKNSYDFRQEIANKIKQTLRRLQILFEDKYAIYVAQINFEEIWQAMLADGMPRLQDKALMASPFVIRAIEKHFKLVRTGSYELFFKRWNTVYYTPQCCQLYNKIEICLCKTMLYRDTENFKRYYRQLSPDQQMKDYGSMSLVIEYGNVEVLKWLISLRNGDMSALLNHKNMFGRSTVIQKAVQSTYDTSEMIRYLWSIPKIRDNTTVNTYLLSEIPHCNDGNMQAFLSVIPLDNIDVNPILHQLAGSGFINSFTTLVGKSGRFNVNAISQQTWDNSFVAAASDAHQELVRYIRPHISHEIDFPHMLFHTFHNFQVEPFKLVVTLPEITGEHIQAFLLRLRLGSYRYRACRFKYIIKQGKISQDELNTILDQN